MDEFKYKRDSLKKVCQTNNIEYEEVAMQLWHHFVNWRSIEETHQLFGIGSLPDENFEEKLVRELMKNFAIFGIKIEAKEFFEKYVVKIIFRYSTNDENNKSEVLIVATKELLKLAVREEKIGSYCSLYKLMSSFDIHWEKEYRYSLLSNTVYELQPGSDELIKTYGNKNGKLIFDEVERKYNFIYKETNSHLDENYIGFQKGVYEYITVVDIRYFCKLYFSMVKSKKEKGPVFVVEDTEENVAKIKKNIEQGHAKFAICDYKDSRFYIKCLSGEDDEMLFHLQL